MEGGEEDLNENYFNISNSSITEVGIFKAVCDIWTPWLCTEVPPSHELPELCYNAIPALPPHMSEAAELGCAEQLRQGGKCCSPAQQEGQCSKGPAGRDSPAAEQSWAPACPTAQGATPAMGWNPAHPCTPQLVAIQVSVLTQSLKSSSESFKKMGFGWNCKEEPPLFSMHR